ncbi:MAG: class I adenylate-forming enzyme family protein [Bauldia sp.]
MLDVVAGIKAAAARNAYQPALITEGRAIGYGDLLAAVARVSNDLAARRLPPLTRAVLEIADPDLKVTVLVACLHAGLVPFALANPALRADLGPHIVIADAPPGAAAADIHLDPRLVEGRAGDSVLRELPDRSPSDPLFLGATSGTTGRPKLVAELRGVHASRTDQAGMQYFEPGERVMFSVGAATVVGITFVLRMLSLGATNVRQADPETSVRLINLTRVRHWRGTPGAIGDMMDAMEKAGAKCPTVRRMVLFGSLFPVALVERIERNFDAELVVSYGSAESGRVTWDRIDSRSFEPGYVGRLLPDVELLAAGTPAEPAQLVIGNPRTGFRPYVEGGRIAAPETRRALPDVGYAVGDRLYLVGRDDEVININGVKTAFSTVERVLRALPGVRDVAVVGGGALGEPSTLIVGVTGAPTLALDELKKALLVTALPPRAEANLRLFRLDRVPRNVTGKVDRDAVVRAWRESLPGRG